VNPSGADSKALPAEPRGLAAEGDRPTTDDATNTNSEPSVLERLLRAEGLVSNAALRVDVAGTLSRLIGGDESVALDSQTVHARGDYAISRGRRSRRVDGTYERSVDKEELYRIESVIEERVDGAVDVHTSMESGIIVGGAYVNTIAGAYLRVTAWTDFLAWGGWVEADLVRIEIAGLMMRSHMTYGHVAGARLVSASSIVDDFTTRTESFGALNDNAVTRFDLGSPGGGITLES